MKTRVAFLLVGLLAFGTHSVRAQRGAFEKAYRERDWKAAASAGVRWAEAEPKNFIAAYDVACAFSLAGDTDSALRWLARAGEGGFSGVRSIDEDPDLDAVRGESGFAAATEIIRANRVRMFANFRQHAEQAEILTVVPRRPFDGPRPLIVVLHGYGDTPEANVPFYRKVAAEIGAIVAAPSALRPRPSGLGFSWTFRDEAEWWVLRAIERIKAEHEVDAQRIILAGFSQGANVALEVGLRHPDRLAGLLPIAGRWDSRLMRSPAAGGPRVYLLTGERDRSAATFEEAERALAAAGLEVRLRVVPNLGHSYPARPTRELRVALEFLLGE
jgi:phospholipase/carboxylesterase